MPNLFFTVYTFEQYLTLSRKTKSLATRYWCACLKAYLGASSAYDVKKKLLTAEEKLKNSADWLNKSSRFFNKKEQGEPVIRLYVVEDIDRRANAPFSFASLLCHPLWQLIDNRTPSKHSINLALTNLPHHYVQMLFSPDEHGNLVRKKKLSNNAIKTLYRSTDIHAFTCWIAFTLELIDHDNPQMMDATQLSAIQYLLKMTLATPFAAIAEDLYLYLHHQFRLYFHRHANPFHYVLIYYKPDRERISLPLRLISNYCVSIKPTLELYEELYRRAIQTGIVTESHQERITFFNFIRHTEIQELSDILYQSKNHPSDLRDLKHQIFRRIFAYH